MGAQHTQAIGSCDLRAKEMHSASGRASIGARWRQRLAKAKDPLNQSHIAFYSGHLCERGTVTAMFDYADFSESILGMTSYVIYDFDSRDNFSGCVDRFRARFGHRLIGVPDFDGVDAILEQEHVAHLYLIKVVVSCPAPSNPIRLARAIW